MEAIAVIAQTIPDGLLEALDSPWPYLVGVAGLGLVLYAAKNLLRAVIDRLVSGTAAIKPRKPRPLLQPCEAATIAQIEQTGRFPIEPTVNERGRIGFFRRVLTSRVSPISPKPVFLLSTWNKEDGSSLARDPLEFAAGGYRLLLRPHDSEDRGHLAFSIGAIRLRASRMLMICAPEDYFHPTGKVHCCLVNWARAPRARDQTDTLIVYSANSLHNPEGWNYRIENRSEVRHRGIWLISLDRHGGRQPLRQLDPTDRHQAGRPIEADCGTDPQPPSGRRERALRRSRDRCRLRRRWWLLLPTLCVSQFLLWFWEDYRNRLWQELSEEWILFIGAFFASLSVFYTGALFLVIRLIRYVRYERFASVGWTATATRCLVDSAHARDGMYRQLTFRERRLAQRDRSQDPASRPTGDEPKMNGLLKSEPQDTTDDGAETAAEDIDTGAGANSGANPQDRRDTEPT